jgi:hypothetical protein
MSVSFGPDRGAQRSERSPITSTRSAKGIPTSARLTASGQAVEHVTLVDPTDGMMTTEASKSGVL